MVGSQGGSDRHMGEIAKLKSKVLQASTPEEIAEIWREVQQLQSRGPAPPAPKLTEAALPDKHSAPSVDGCETASGSRTPTSVSSDWTDKSPLPATPSQGLIVRNTFIETVEGSEEGPARRRSRSCPHSPVCVDSAYSTVSGAAERLLADIPKLRSTPDFQIPATPEDNTPFLSEAEHDEVPTLTLPLMVGSACLGEACIDPLARAASREAAKPPPTAEQLCPPGMPSIGSVHHALGNCKPCAFVHTKGCSSGKACQFCHLCAYGCAKRRKKAWKQQQQRAAESWRNCLRTGAAMGMPTGVGMSTMGMAYPGHGWMVMPR